MAQFVILGAGYDTRAYRLPANSPVRCFEVDTPATQANKRTMLAHAGVDGTRVTFVSADFLREDWFDKLRTAGFESDEPTFFLWEGVTGYLDRQAVEHTLPTIAGTAAGSMVVFDSFTADVIAAKTFSMRLATAALRAAGEPLRFGIDSSPPLRERVAESVATCGLSLAEHCTFGLESSTQHAIASFAVASVGTRTSASPTGAPA